MKRVFPAIWFGFVIVAGMLSIVKGTMPPQASLFFILVLVFMIVFGIRIMKRIAWSLMDAVYDFGDFLLVRRGNVEDQVPIADIMNVGFSFYSPIITLKLRRQCAFGTEVQFYPTGRMSRRQGVGNRIAEDLIFRVDTARSNAQTPSADYASHPHEPS